MLADTPLPHGFGAALASVDTFSKGSRTVRYLPALPCGSMRWDAWSDRVPPLQTIIFSSFPGRTKGCRPYAHNRRVPRNGDCCVVVTAQFCSVFNESFLP